MRVASHRRIRCKKRRNITNKANQKNIISGSKRLCDPLSRRPSPHNQTNQNRWYMGDQQVAHFVENGCR
jgi:hypothetical protein